MNNKDSENNQKTSILRWIAAVAVALLISYLRANGYLPENPQQAPHEEQITAENTQEAPQEEQTTLEAEQEQSTALTRESFCRTTYEVFVHSFCDSDGDGIGDLPGLVSKLDYINDGDPSGGKDLGMTGLWLMPVFPSNTYHKYDVTDFVGIDPSYGTLGCAHRSLPRKRDDSDPGFGGEPHFDGAPLVPGGGKVSEVASVRPGSGEGRVPVCVVLPVCQRAV